MKIIQMNLEEFGIYHDIAWNPPEKGLVVMHGQNESGKTTLMKYVRSMFFGYQRGDWKGYRGHMDIRRDDGHEYRIYRNEKESYIMDGDVAIHEEPADLWWHSLERRTYDQIFAMGLEDLQGFKILANEEVRSHFFSIEGGVQMGITRRDVTRLMGELLVASPQGKKPINALIQEQRDFDRRIQTMAYDEDEFAELQAKERSTHEMENRIRLDIEETKQQIEKISMPIAAWDVYKRGQDAMKRMQELADVAQFPEDGAQKWTDLENKIKEMEEQINKLSSTSRQGPAFQPEWNKWLSCGSTLETLYQHTAEWKQGLVEIAEKADAEMDWQFECNQYAQTLQQWSQGSVPESVDWSRGLSLATSLQRLEQEQAKWEAAKPKNVMAATEQADDTPVRTKEEWNAIGKAISTIQTTLVERDNVKEQLQWLQAESRKGNHTMTIVAAFFIIVAMACLYGSLTFAIDQTMGMGGALGCAVLAVVAYGKKRFSAGQLPKKISELETRSKTIDQTLTTLAEQAHVDIDIAAAKEAWNTQLDEIRKTYMDWQTHETKTEWEREQKVMYDAIYDKWHNEGKDWQQKVAACRASWEQWLADTGLMGVTIENIQDVKAVWEKWKAVASSMAAWQQRKQELQEKLAQWHDETKQVFGAIGVSADSTPEQLEAIYKKWQHIRVQAEVTKEQDKQQDERNTQIKELQKDIDIRKRQQQDLLGLVGAQTVGEFRSKVLKFRQFKQYKEIYEQSEAHIRLIAKNPKNLAALRHELKIHTLKNWTDERAYYEKKIADAEKKLADVAEKRGTFIERLSQMAKSETYTQLLQEKENRKAELDSHVDNWLTYAFAQHILGEAQQYYERVRQPIVIKQASEYLHLMTQGKYTLQATFDGKQLYAVDSMQRRIPEKQWSSGLGDQIYLAIRISLAMAFSKQIEPMPLILDDIFVRFDEQRQKEAMQFLADLGKTEQIFLFTCSRTTRDIADEVRREFAGETNTVHLFEIEQGTIKDA